MPNLKAITTVLHNGKRYRPGEIVPDVGETDAEVLIARGQATDAPVEPTEKPAAKAKADKPAA